MTLEVRILGCGSSGGVPRLGEGAPNWGACDPENPKNRRSRCSILVTKRTGRGETRVLVDTSPDMREQLLAAKIGRLDAVLITHDHADQLHGMDDLRVITINMRRRLDLWSDRSGLNGACGVRHQGSASQMTGQGSHSILIIPPAADARGLAS